MKTKTKVQQRYDLCERCLSDKIDPELKSLCRFHQIVDRIQKIKISKSLNNWYNIYKKHSRDVCVGCKYKWKHDQLKDDKVIIIN